VAVGTEKVSELIPAITVVARPMAACRPKDVILGEKLLRMVATIPGYSRESRKCRSCAVHQPDRV